MISAKKKTFLIGTVVLIAFGWLSFTVMQQLQDDRSFLGQLKLILFPKKYVPNPIQNLQSDLQKAQGDWAHTVRGREYAAAGDYDKAIEEYKKAIEIIESDPGEQWNNVSKTEMDRINEDERVFNQKFPRRRLVEVYEKADRYPEALEQINWLLTHKPLDHVRAELLTKKQEILQKIAQTQSNP